MNSTRGQNWTPATPKFLTDAEVNRLRAVAAQQATEARRKGQMRAVRDSLIINLALFTGLRVQEIAKLKCGDIMIREDTAFITVQSGKGNKPRLVHFSAKGAAPAGGQGPASGGNGGLKAHLLAYLDWKTTQGEGIEAGDPLLFSRYPSQRDPPQAGAGHLSKRAVQRAFERMSKAAGINHHCFHHLRHTYASHLYKASGYNLRLVQKQLGHASIRTTQVYADVFDEDINKAVEKIYPAMRDKGKSKL